jgi:fructokinase
LKSRHLVLGIGELLWDMLPQGQRLGGAPANFAVMAARLGDRAVILSRIGNDDLGRRAIASLSAAPADAASLQVDPAHPTGSVTVSLSAGEPQYTIDEPAAWDFLALSDEWIRLAERAGAICFGTLAQRSAQSRQTIQTVAATAPPACLRVLDVNLRAPFYSSEVIQESIEMATVLKMNEDETPLVLELLQLNANRPKRLRTRNQSLRAAASALLEEFSHLALVVITRGSRGSLLVTREEWSDHPGFRTQVADTVGAGDAFTAALVHYLLQGADLKTLNEAGNRWGAWMASQSGAMPDLPETVLGTISAATEHKSQTGSSR